MDAKRIKDAWQELTREYGDLMSSVGQRRIATQEIGLSSKDGAGHGLELARLRLVHDALEALESLLDNYSDRSEAALCAVCGVEDRDYDCFRMIAPPPEEMHVVLVDDSLVSQGEELITGCEKCSEMAELTFEYLLDALTGCNPAVTEYLLCRPAMCPHCRAAVTEKTLVLSD